MEFAIEISSFIGIIAGIITTSALIPQAVKIYRNKSARDISLAMFIFLAVGICLWLFYGILLGELPLILANSFSLLFILSIIIMKIRYG